MAAGLTLKEAVQQTHDARRRCGWDAVAPALEPYLDASYWPSGAPLPRQLVKHARKRRLSPPYLPQYDYIGIFLCWAAYIGVLICMGVYAFSPTLRNLCSGDGITKRVAAFAVAFLSPFLLLELLYVQFEWNDELASHVRVLYLLLYLDKASPAARHSLLQRLSLKTNLSSIRLHELDWLPEIPSDVDGGRHHPDEQLGRNGVYEVQLPEAEYLES